MIAHAAGLPILRGRLHLPRVGVWHAELSCAGEDAAPTGAIELELEGVTWLGTVRRGGADHGRIELVVVGGAGGLDREIEPRYYVDAPASIPLDDLLRETGEALASDVAAEIRSTLLARWTRPRARAGAALAELVKALGVESWRVRADGSLWLGAETWSEVDVDHVVIERDPRHDRIAIGVDAPELVPGVTFDGRRVSHVVHTLAPSAVRTEVWFEV